MTTESIQKARRMIANGATVHQVALILEVSPKTIYRYIPATEQRELQKTAACVVSAPAQQQSRESI